MKKIVILSLIITSSIVFFILSPSSQSENHTQVSAESVGKAIWGENEKIPFANKHFKIKNVSPQGITVTEYKTGANGEWKSEILQSPTPSQVGIITIWDTEKVSTFYPHGKILSIKDGFEQNEKVFPHEIFSGILKEKIKNEEKLTGKDEKHSIFTKERFVPVIKDSIKRQDGTIVSEKALPEFVKRKVKFHLNTEKDKITKVETINESGKLIGTVEITEEKIFEPGSSEFVINKSRAELVK